MVLRLAGDDRPALVPGAEVPPVQAGTEEATRTAVGELVDARATTGLLAEVVFQAPEVVMVNLEARVKHYLADDTQSTLDPGRSLERHPRGDWVDDREPSLSTTLVFIALFTFTFPSAVAAANHGWWYFAATAGVWGVATTSYIGWRLLDPLRLTRAQRRMLTTPVSYGGWLADTTPANTDLPPGSYPAVALALVARSLVAGIRSGPAWGHQILDTHHVRLDLDRALADVMDAARALALLQRTPSTPAGGPPAASADHEEQVATLGKVIMERLVALCCYGDGLAPLESLLSDRTTYRLQQELDTQLVHTSPGANATVQLNKVTTELADVEANLTAQIDVLKGHLTVQRI